MFVGAAEQTARFRSRYAAHFESNVTSVVRGVGNRRVLSRSEVDEVWRCWWEDESLSHDAIVEPVFDISLATRTIASDHSLLIGRGNIGPNAALPSASLSTNDVRDLWTYSVPLELEHGQCSMSHEVSPIPFNLAAVVDKEYDDDHASMEELRAVQRDDWAFLCQLVSAQLSGCAVGLEGMLTLRQWRLQQVVQQLAVRLRAEWVGIYRVVGDPHHPQQRTLVKEAYVGEVSRAMFPLTLEFAEGSNNSLVGMTGVCVIIADTLGADAGSYYQCSTKVRSEVCAAIVDGQGNIIGIIDVEAWRVNNFDADAVGVLLHACRVLGQIRLAL